MSKCGLDFWDIVIVHCFHIYPAWQAFKRQKKGKRKLKAQSDREKGMGRLQGRCFLVVFNSAEECKNLDWSVLTKYLIDCF